ncbi:MAG: RimK/LysX family protein [Gammaproteobacteria bacterium]
MCEKSAPIIGRVEYVVMEDVRMKLKARIDTGAGVSSIDAKIMQLKPAADGSGEKVIFEIKDDEGKIKSPSSGQLWNGRRSRARAPSKRFGDRS